MIRTLQSRKYLPLYLLTLFLIATLLFPPAAGAYIARSTGETTACYGTSRSQPLEQGSPTIFYPLPSSPGKQVDPVKPDPALPALTDPVSPLPQQAYGYSGSSHGLARSSGWRFYSYIPAAPSVDPPLPPTPAAPPKEPEIPAVPPPTSHEPPPPADGETAAPNPQEQQLFNLVNSERVSRGLAPLQLDAQLIYLARLKSQEMIDLNYFAHASPTYGSSGEMLKNAGVKFSLAAENIGVGGSIKAIFDAFMNSSGHRNKIVDSRYSRTGIGIIYQPGRGYLITQLFLAPR